MNNFCSAPFRGFYQGLDGKISVCCQTPVLIDNKNYEEVLQDEKIKNLRKKFLKNEIPVECKSCTKRVRNETTKLCESDNENFKVDEHVPVFLDLLWSNKCNFSCMGCNPRISSSMLKYKSAVDLVDPYNNLDANYSWDSSEEQQNRIDFILKHKDTIKSIHLNGGEPLMQEGFYDLLERLIKYNATNIGIWSHTNGSITTYKKKDILQLLKQFDKCKIIMSHDGIGNKGEYVRFGLKQDVWLKNYNRFISENIQVDVQVCYNVFNCLQLEKMADWYEENLNVKPNLSIWNWPPAYSAQYIKKNKKLYEEAMLILETHGKRFRKFEYVIDFMKQSLEHDLNEMHWRFSESISEFDKLRGTDFLETFPELEELYY